MRSFALTKIRTHFDVRFLDSQLITFGETQVSIFNYESGDLLMSLDLMKSYGNNLTTFEFEEVRIVFLETKPGD